jgi:hypothetical protein
MFNDSNNLHSNYSNLQDARHSKEIKKLGLQQTFSSDIKNNSTTDENETAVIFKKHIYNIDSRNRNTHPQNMLTGKNKYLTNNALLFTNDSLIINVSVNNHGLAKGNKIILQNVKSTIYQSKGGVELTNNSYFVKILQINHGITGTILNNVDFKIKISGLEGNSDKYTFGNIPISIINNEHKIYLFSDNSSVPNTDYYFIKLDIKTNIDSNTMSDTSSNIIIEHKNIYGIPLNHLNTNFPLSHDQLFSNHVVEDVLDNNTFTIRSREHASKVTGSGGGNNMYISSIKYVIDAYPYPNRYKINLGDELFKVNQIKILSTIFPNNGKMIIKNVNNKLYWEDLYNSGYIYEISLDAGNYTTEELSSAIEEKINETEILLLENKIIKIKNATIIYFKYFSSTVTINKNTSRVTFEFFKQLTLSDGISKIYFSSFLDDNIRIKIDHPNHNLLENDTVIISNAIDTDAIPESVLNSTHIIEKIIDVNSYQIKLPLFNPSSTTTLTFGGANTILKIPVKVRMFFNKPINAGKVLGFTRSGEEHSVTPFDFIIANNYPYANDTLKDSTGTDITYDAVTNTIQNNDLFLNDTKYIIMSSDMLQSQPYTLVNSNIENALCKITLKHNKRSTLDDEYSQLIQYLEKPIDITTDIEFSFYNIDGTLHNFYGKDHSFVIEFTSMINTLNNGLYDTRHGISNSNHKYS